LMTLSVRLGFQWECYCDLSIHSEYDDQNSFSHCLLVQLCDIEQSDW
jgi:hypothetical protein